MFKKVILAAAAVTVFNLGVMGIASAAPINDLAKGQTALGVLVHNSDPSSNTFYIENRVGDNFTLGYQNVDWDWGGNANDIYGQIDLNSNLRAIVGNRDYASQSKFYGGVAVTAPLAPNWGGYASYITSSNFNEFQVGANYNMAANVDLNLNYRSFSPDYGKDNNGVGIGATFKF